MINDSQEIVNVIADTLNRHPANTFEQIFLHHKEEIERHRITIPENDERPQRKLFTIWELNHVINNLKNN